MTAVEMCCVFKETGSMPESNLWALSAAGCMGKNRGVSLLLQGDPFSFPNQPALPEHLAGLGIASRLLS